MKNDENGHGSETPKEITIILNSEKKPWSTKEITFKEVIILAFGEYVENEQIAYSVTYSKGPDDKKEGTMIKGSVVKVKEGMIFNVTRSNKG